MAKFQAKRIKTTVTLTIPTTPEQVYPLLCPVREYDWIPGWSCDLIYTESGLAEKGCIFRTSFPGEGQELWVVSRYEPEERRFEVVRSIEGSRVVHVEVSLTPRDDGSTDMVWTETTTALDDEGNAYIDGFSEEGHVARMRLLGQALSHFCETGKLIGAEI